MEYPSRLQPRQNFKKIIIDSYPNLCFVRHTKSKNIWSPLGRLKVDAVYINENKSDKDIFGLSINLFGIFNEKDVAYKVTNREFTGNWEEGEIVKELEDSDFETNPERGLFYIKKEIFHNQSFPYLKPVNSEEKEFQSYCQITHIPTKCNFWHFEIRFKDSDGNLIKRGKKSAWIKLFGKSLIRSVLKKYAFKENSECQLLPVAAYSLE